MSVILLLAAQAMSSSSDLGKSAGRCRPGEDGSAFLVEVVGLKDRRGFLKLELYPDRDGDFLADDNVLLAAGKTFRRVEIPVPSSGPITMCIRAPGPGRYAISILHDRDGDRRFALSKDGVGFAGNPKLAWSKPRANDASASVGSGPVRIRVIMNYRRGLVSFGPIKD